MADRLRLRTAPLLALAGAAFAVAGEGANAPLPPPQPVQQVPGFTHGDHEDLACFACHENTLGHGAITVTTIEDCRGCHHAPTTAQPCSRCHATAELPSDYYAVVRPIELSIGVHDATRSLGFPHEDHGDIDCTRCHTQGPSLAVAADLDCSSCHQDHHTTRSDCAACHAPVHVSRHPPAEVHVTCSGAACHQDLPFESVPRTREFCLGCHREMRLHEAPLDCIQCHILPAPRTASR